MMAKNEHTVDLHRPCHQVHVVRSCQVTHTHISLVCQSTNWPQTICLSTKETVRLGSPLFLCIVSYNLNSRMPPSSVEGHLSSALPDPPLACSGRVWPSDWVPAHLNTSQIINLQRQTDRLVDKYNWIEIILTEKMDSNQTTNGTPSSRLLQLSGMKDRPWNDWAEQWEGDYQQTKEYYSGSVTRYPVQQEVKTATSDTLPD